MSDGASLSDLRDIAIPAEPSMWPPAAGFWILLFLLLLMLGAAALHFYTAWRRNAYRRAGIHFLQQCLTVYDVSVLLKRVAMAAFSRERVASLHGMEWVDFLNKTGPGSGFADLMRDEVDIPAGESLKAAAGEWIRRHRTAGIRKTESEG